MDYILFIAFLCFVGYLFFLNVQSREMEKGVSKKKIPQSNHMEHRYNLGAGNIERASLQVLETTKIMNETKNLDTLRGRAEFLREKVAELKESQHSNKYSYGVQKGIDHFKTTFYNSEIYEWQAGILLHPDRFDFEHFYIQSLLNAFDRHYDDQIKEIEKLKTDRGKRNRFKNLAEVFNDFVCEFDSDWGSDSANNYKEKKLQEVEILGKNIKENYKKLS